MEREKIRVVWPKKKEKQKALDEEPWLFSIITLSDPEKAARSFGSVIASVLWRQRRGSFDKDWIREGKKNKTMWSWRLNAWELFGFIIWFYTMSGNENIGIEGNCAWRTLVNVIYFEWLWGALRSHRKRGKRMKRIRR